MTPLQLIRSFVVATACLLPAVAAAQPQPPPVPQEFLSNKRPVGESELRFCLNMSSALAEFDRAVAQEIAGALLLEPRFFEVRVPTEPYPLDFRIDLTEEDFFIIMNKRCDAFLGYALSPLTTPDWLVPTIPYYVTQFRLVSLAGKVRSLRGLPARTPVGSLLGSSADATLRGYLTNPGSPDLRRLPYPDNQLLIERLRDGSLAAILIWEPAVYLAAKGDPRSLDLGISSDLPFALGPVELGMAVRSNEAFLRSNLDEAIKSLGKEGVLDAVRARFKLPPAASSR